MITTVQTGFITAEELDQLRELKQIASRLQAALFYDYTEKDGLRAFLIFALRSPDEETLQYKSSAHPRDVLRFARALVAGIFERDPGDKL
jgi:hypothetical protein